MKYLILFLFLFSGLFSIAQENLTNNVVITRKKGRTQVQTNETGAILVNVSPNDARSFKAKGVVRYSDFGGRGDGKTDDMDAIVATHAFANQNNLKVKADTKATYYIGGKNRTAIIRTDTDFGAASFIIDDTNVQNRNANVFLVNSNLQPFKLEAITSL
jgi:hypothetical protein